MVRELNGTRSLIRVPTRYENDLAVGWRLLEVDFGHLGYKFDDLNFQSKRVKMGSFISAVKSVDYFGHKIELKYD